MKFQIDRDAYPLERLDGLLQPPSSHLEMDDDVDWMDFMTRVRDECLPAEHQALWIVLSLHHDPTLLALLPRKPMAPMLAPKIGGRVSAFYPPDRQGRLHLVHAGDRDPQSVYDQLAGLVTGTL